MSRRIPLRLFVLLLVVTPSLACAPDRSDAPPAIDPATERSVAEGRLVGFVSEDGAHAWRGIPFAKAPVGSLRWRAPLPPPPFDGRFEALRYGSPCVQLAGPGGGADGAEAGEPTGSEDCLFLNIYAPRFEPDRVPVGLARLPVMVWIHGGGNSVGDASLYDGSRIALAHGMIVVTVHYRLGILGWFSHPSLRGRDASPDDRSGNYGTLDLIRALTWVQQNIAAFGGDPQRVTIFGESAGWNQCLQPAPLAPRRRPLSPRHLPERRCLDLLHGPSRESAGRRGARSRAQLERDSLQAAGA